MLRKFTSLVFPSNWARTSCGNRLFFDPMFFFIASSPPIIILCDEDCNSSIISLPLSFFLSFFDDFSSFSWFLLLNLSSLVFGLFSLIKYFSSFELRSLAEAFCIISRGAGLGGSGVFLNLDVGDGDAAGDISRISFGSSTIILGLLSHFFPILFDCIP